MSDDCGLSPYFARQSVKRLQLKDPLAGHVERILALLDPDTGRAVVAQVHEALFPFTSTSSANKSLNRLTTQLNELAESRGNPLRIRVTIAKSGGPTKRFVWFEGPVSAPPAARTTELDSIPADRLVDSRGTDPNEPVVVLITYNEHETAAVLGRFGREAQPITEQRGGRSFSLLGVHNGWRLVHLVSRQGEDYSQLSTSKAIAAWQPAAVIGVGIAFGVDKENQYIGDVLVSEAIQGYEFARVNPGGDLALRDIPRPASEWLVQRVLTCDHQQRHAVTQWPTVRPGVLLSGNKLVDDQDYRDSLIRLVPQKVVGGEMEGVGLALAADDAKVDWVVVKGICDWADGHKGGATKDRDQRLAAHNAVAVVAEMLRECPPVDRGQWSCMPSGGDRRTPPGAPSVRRMRMKDLETIDPAVLISGPLGMPSTMDKDDVSQGRGPAAGDGVDVMTALHDWVDAPDGPPVFALLGEYGMGKTVTAQRLARELESKREDDPTRPAALYFDLRSVTGLDKGVPTLARVVEECMKRGWAADEDPAAYTWASVLGWLKSSVVVIFDGLDEVLVKLDAGDGQTLTRTLLATVEEQRALTGRARVLVTCRTHYFRTLREQSNHFVGQERGNLREDAYRSLVLMPLTEAQIVAYLAAAVPGSRPEEVLEMLRSVHDLTDLTHRPYTLQLVSQFLPEIEADRAAGRPVYGVTLYRRMVTRWLERDAGKHHLRPDDKIDLAEHLAAHLHGAGAGLLDVTALEDWMHEWLETSPRLARRYARLHPDQLEEDLRTATFLARIDGSEGSGFRFAHTSLREYFHACHLFAAIKADDPGAWDIEVPSRETLDFLGQLLAERGGSELLARLTSWGRERGGRVSRVILQYAVAAANGGWPTPSLARMDLRHADLSEVLVCGPAAGSPLDLRGAQLRDANLRSAALRHVDLTGADFDRASAAQATFSDSRLANLECAEADFTSAAFVRSDLTGADLSVTVGKHPVLVGGVEPTHLPIGVRSAQVASKSPERLVWTGLPRSNVWWGVAWAPDGSRVVSAGDDGTVRVWEVATGECVRAHGVIVSDEFGAYGEAVWDPRTNEVLLATGDAWRCLIRIPRDAPDWSDWRPVDCTR